MDNLFCKYLELAFKKNRLAEYISKYGDNGLVTARLRYDIKMLESKLVAVENTSKIWGFNDGY